MNMINLVPIYLTNGFTENADYISYLRRFIQLHVLNVDVYKLQRNAYQQTTLGRYIAIFMKYGSYIHGIRDSPDNTPGILMAKMMIAEHDNVPF